jgi:uncharacterized membrane protein YgcG
LLRKPVVLGSLALALAFVPAHAGTVYVPFATQQQIGGVQYRTDVLVSNSGDVARRFTTAFIATGRDGRTVKPSTAATIPPNTTFVLTNTAPAGSEGMIEVTGAPQIAVSARLVAISSSGQVLGSTPLPAAGSANLTPKGATAQIQGVSRTAAGMGQRFGLINLGSAAAACTAAAFRSTGAAIGSPVRFTAPVRSHSALGLPFSSLTSLFTDARVEVTCNQPFYAYGLLIGPEAGRTVFLGASGTLESKLAAASSLRGDGDDGGSGGGGGNGGGNGGGEDGGSGGNGGGTGNPTTGQDTLSFPGVFLAAKQGNSTRAFALPLQAGVRYRRITVDFDLFLNKWQTPLFHAVTSLRRNDKTLYYGLILRGDKAKTLIDLSHEQMAKADGPWKQGTQYHLRFETDAASRTVTFKLFQGGNQVHTVTGSLVSNDLSVPAGRTMSVDFGLGKVADGAYFPPIGWQYSNLVVKAERF